MQRMTITTNRGDVYKIDADGNIIRTDIEGFQASGEWKLVGIEHVRSYRRFVRAEHIADWLKKSPQLLYKNGNPQWTIRDLDHGTIRSWGNTRYHGIRSIEVEPEYDPRVGDCLWTGNIESESA
jgi:hypothetical protein